LVNYREKYDFALGIALLDPNENPFTLMTMKFGRGTSGNIKHSWLSDVLQPETDSISSAATTGQTEITVAHQARFAVGDVLRHETGNEVMLVTSSGTTDAAGVITVVRDYAATSTSYTARADTLGASTYLQIIGNAFEQGHALPTIKATKEVQTDNYCQDLRTPCGMSEIAAAAAVRGEMDWPFQQRKKGIEHMRKEELKNLWGIPYAGDGSLFATTNTDPAMSAGLHYLISASTGSDRLVSQSDITESEFMDFIEAAFEYGSAKKVMFGAPKLRSALDYWGITKRQTTEVKNVWGMDVVKWVSSHGTIVFITHKMLKAIGSEGAYNFLIDMNDVKWITYSNIGSTRWRPLEPYKSDGSTVKKGEFQTISCIEMREPKKHAILYGVKTYS